MAQMASGGLKLGIGLSLGLSLGALANQNIVNRIFPKPEPPPAPQPTSAFDAKLVEQLISHDRKVNQLETQLSLLRDDLRERQQQAEAQMNATTQAPARANGNVFELSQVIQANNLANSAKYERDMEEQRRMLVREHLLKVEGEILKVENKYRPVINKIRELESHLETQRQFQQKERPARLLWMSCQSLLERLSCGSQEPLEKDPAYHVLTQLAANNDHLAISILDSIPTMALKEGVQSERMLSERFNRIDGVCRRVALVDERGGGLTKYLLSYLQSLFIIHDVGVPEDELLGNKLVDTSKWTTFDVLARVRYCLSNNDLEQAVRYANQLRGQARVVARDWIRDARVHLTTRQAFSTLSALYSCQPDLNNNMATWPK